MQYIATWKSIYSCPLLILTICSYFYGIIQSSNNWMQWKRKQYCINRKTSGKYKYWRHSTFTDICSYPVFIEHLHILSSLFTLFSLQMDNLIFANAQMCVTVHTLPSLSFFSLVSLTILNWIVNWNSTYKYM